MMHGIIALALALLPALATAQQFPDREIRALCNFAPGSGADVIVRYYSDRLSRLAGKPVVVENKPGAAGTIATTGTSHQAGDSSRSVRSDTASVATNISTAASGRSCA